MSFIDRNIYIQPRRIGGRGLVPTLSPRQPAPPTRTMREALEAGFALENDVINAIEYFNRPRFTPDPEHNPIDIIKGTRYEGLYLDRFISSNSEAETRAIMSRIDREEALQEQLSQSGWKGYVAAAAAGILSPTIFIPVGGVLRATAGAGRGIRAAATAATAASAVAAQEVVLQTAQETRTTFESLFAIGAGTIIGGVFGASISRGLTRAQLAEIAESANRIPASPEEMRAVADQALGAQASTAGRGPAVLKSSGGVGESIARLSPGLRTETSPIEATRQTVRDLIATPETLDENAEGIASSVAGSVEANVDAALGPLFDVTEHTRRQFSQYRFGRRVPLAPGISTLLRGLGIRGNRMSFDQFKEAVFDAALRNDTHPIAEVAAAAAYRRSNLINPLRDEAIDVIPGFRELVEQSQADPSYVTRLWNRNVIRGRRNELVEILARHFSARERAMLRRIEDAEAQATSAEELAKLADQKAKIAASLSDRDVRSLADETVDAIMGHSPARLIVPGDLLDAGPRGPLKERMLLGLPTARVRDFVERDIDVIDNIYTRTMAADIALTRKFGDVKLEGQIARINDEANRLSAGKSEKETRRIQSRKEQDVIDILAMRDRIRGTYALPDNPEGLAHRTLSTFRTFNYLTALGMMTVSSIPDMAKPVIEHGMLRVFRTAVHPLIRGLRSVNLARKEVRLAGTAADMINNDRVQSLYDVFEDAGRGSRFERAVAAGGRAFSIITLMAPWNAAMKQFAGIITQTRALQAMEIIAKGNKPAVKEVERLAAGGVDSNLAKRIYREFAAHGQKDGPVWMANTQAWTDREAVRAFRSLLNREVDRTIVTPGVGDKPLFMSKELGKVVGQFQAFAIASTQRTLLSGLQQRDMAVLNGMMLAMGLGMLAYMFKTNIVGREVSDNPAVWVREAVDQSGLLGIFMNVNNAIEKITGDRFGLAALTGEPGRRYINVNAMGAFLGPSFGKASDILSLFGSASTGELTKSDIHKARKLVPLQNLFYTRWLFDRAEDGINEALQIPDRRSRR